MKAGCYTAIITPFYGNGELDCEGFERLISFQIENGITGILAAGTTGESPTLKWEEHDDVIAMTAKGTRGKCLCIAGTGSNNTSEALEALEGARLKNVDTVLMVDPYYNGPSSIEIRKEYYEPAARQFPDIEVIPYIIPGRTGTQMFPQDLGILARSYDNVNSVKEATGDLENMRLTRKFCGQDFKIFSGDDALIFSIMTDPEIKACGGISVMSNIAPKFFTRMIELLNRGDIEEALKINKALEPLFELIVLTTEEETEFGKLRCRARNPLPLKTLMQLLGMPSGPCRRPLGKMTKQGFGLILNAAKKVQADNPEIFEPIESFFNIDVRERLNNPKVHQDFWYD